MDFPQLSLFNNQSYLVNYITSISIILGYKILYHVNNYSTSTFPDLQTSWFIGIFKVTKSCFTFKGLMFGKTAKESGTRVCGNSVTDTLLVIQKALDLITEEKNNWMRKNKYKMFTLLLWTSAKSKGLTLCKLYYLQTSYIFSIIKTLSCLTMNISLQQSIKRCVGKRVQSGWKV